MNFYGYIWARANDWLPFIMDHSTVTRLGIFSFLVQCINCPNYKQQQPKKYRISFHWLFWGVQIKITMRYIFHWNFTGNPREEKNNSFKLYQSGHWIHFISGFIISLLSNGKLNWEKHFAWNIIFFFSMANFFQSNSIPVAIKN